jgi:hypothetical protein
MKLGNILGVAAALGVTAFAGVASAQEAPPAGPATAASSDGHASGLMVQGRIAAQSSLLSVGGGPSFVLGYQGPSFAVGLGLGLNRIGVSSAPDNVSASLTMFQIMPTAIVDVWHSADGRAHANLVGGVGYGRASVSGTTNTQNCVADGLGNETCTNSPKDFSAGAGFVPFMVGFGGDYYLSRNFALGAEFGLQGAFITGIDSKSGTASRSVDASGNLQLAYSALRATFVLGD